MTVKGKLTGDHAPRVAIELFESSGSQEVILDTGFSDFLYLPENKISAWRLPFVATVPTTLADQTVILADMYEAHLIWFEVSLRVTVLAGPYNSDSLLGMKLLEGCRIELDERTERSASSDFRSYLKQTRRVSRCVEI